MNHHRSSLHFFRFLTSRKDIEEIEAYSTDFDTKLLHPTAEKMSRSSKKINENRDDKFLSKPRERRLSAGVADFCLDWVIFPALLFVQFGSTMYCQMKEGTLNMDWRIVNATIFLFCFVGGVYRQVLRRHPWESLALLLLPELFTNIMLGVVMFGSVEEAFNYLLGFTGVLSFLGLIAAGHVLIYDRQSESSDYQLLLYENGDNEDEWIC
jgi:hypothetical protein